MNLTSPSQVKAWCIENDFHPNKVLGQNFLIDQNALKAIVDAGLEKGGTVEGWNGGKVERWNGGKVEKWNGGKVERWNGGMVECSNVRERPHVLEIGPGLGVLTEEMLKRGCRVTAIEKDPVLAARLKESLGNPEALEVISGDALEWLAQSNNRTVEHSNDFDVMISNLPYQAGTRILLDLVKARQLASMTVLVQTEVAERLAAGPGGKTRGLAGVWAQLDYDVRIVRKVAASCFWPRPEIGSSVVRLDRHDRNLSLSEEERALFHRLTKQAFEHRRKQLGSIFKDLIQSTARAEELANEDWIQLVKGLIG